MASMVSSLTLVAISMCLISANIVHVQADKGTLRSTSGGGKNVKNQIYFLEADDTETDQLPLVRYLREDETYLRPVSGEQRRSLSFWSSFMNFVHCPIHNDHNPHCHHHGGGNGSGGGGNGSGGSGNGNGNGNNGGGGGNGNGNNGSSNNNGGNGNNGGDNGDNYNGDDAYNNNNNGGDNGDNYNGDDAYNNNNDGGNNNDNWNENSKPPTSPPTPDEVSNDMPCWWRGTGCSNNGRSPYFADGSEGSTFGSTSPIFLGIGASVTGIAIITSLVLRKRYQQSTPTEVDAANQHMLSGAVAKRKKTFSEIFRKDSNPIPADQDSPTATNYVKA